jgi:hypothetical protein
VNFDLRPTEKDIQRTFPSGAYLLPCDGRHAFPHHIYYFHTKKEVLRLWFREHPLREAMNGEN